jgi:hypothetical protein
MAETEGIPPLPQPVASTVDAVAVIRSLAHVANLREAAERLQPAPKLGGRVSSDEAVELIVRHTAALIRDRPLLAPARRGFLEWSHLPGPAVDELRSQAQRVLNELVADDAAVTADRRTSGAQSALDYAAAVITQERALAAFEKERQTTPILREASRKRVDDYLLYRSMVGPPKTLQGLMRRWERCVEEIADSPGGILFEEFEQDLLVRDYLGDIGALVGPDEQDAFAAPLHACDRRFWELTLEVHTSLRSHFVWAADGWWWFRLPRKPGERFRSYLTSLSPELAGAMGQAGAHPGDRPPH